MAKFVEKKTIDVVETAKTFEKYESLAIPFTMMSPNSIRTYICAARRDGRLEGEFTVIVNRVDEESVITRVR